jgi:hypothetical protein
LAFLVNVVRSIPSDAAKVVSSMVGTLGAVLSEPQAAARNMAIGTARRTRKHWGPVGEVGRAKILG